MIRLTFAGAARDVTGSRHLIETTSQRVLLDCGLFQGHRQETYTRNLNFSFDPAALNALILSHAHMDHLGDVPNLVKKGYKGDIHCTLATADLAAIMWVDAARIQESDAAFASKVRKKHGQPPVDPLYTTDDVMPSVNLLQGHSYDRSFKAADGVSVTLRDAGHVLGSAITELDIQDGGRHLTVCYTGDLGRPNLPIIRDPFVVKQSDVLIIESTYGNREHGSFGDVAQKLAAIINQTVERSGKIIVPAFALERTQEIIYILHQLRAEQKIPAFPVYVDSPLAIDATEIFRMHPECFDKETYEFIVRDEDPFGFKQLHYVRNVEESKKLNNVSGPSMIIAGSGMAENGRILHHLRNNIGDPRNTILIVGWQAENTLGRKILEKQPRVPIFGELYELGSQVEVIDEFSAHADHTGLLGWIKKGQWGKIFLVHGEETSSLALADDLKNAGYKEVYVPELGQSFEVA